MPLLIHDVCIVNLFVFRNFNFQYDLWLLNNETAFKHSTLQLSLHVISVRLVSSGSRTSCAALEASLGAYCEGAVSNSPPRPYA